jgi:hypothetical protein
LAGIQELCSVSKEPVPSEGVVVESEAVFSIVSVRKDTAMAGAMTGEDKEENEGLEGVQTPKENGTGKYKVHALGSFKFVQDAFKEEEQTLTTLLRSHSFYERKSIMCFT